MSKDFKFGLAAGMVFSAVLLVYYMVSNSPEQSDSARAVSTSTSQAEGDSGGQSVVPLRGSEQRYLPEGGKDILERLAEVSQRPADQQRPVVTPSKQTVPPVTSSQQTSPQKKQPRVYKVVSGDTLSDISKKFYGTTSKWQIILDANRKTLKNPAGLKPGMELVIPEDN